MAATSNPQLAAQQKAQRLRFFISYAREDYNVAIAVSNAIQTATGPSAVVFMDVALPFGVSFHDEIRRRLDETNILVVIHSAVLKPAYGYPGVELGYFMRVIEDEQRPDVPRRIVPIYLEKPPDAIEAKQGISIGISRDTLNMTLETYRATLGHVDYDNSLVGLLRDFQKLVDRLREQYGSPKLYLTDDQTDLPGIAVKMQEAIFSHLKTTADQESALKPQLQITLKTSDDNLGAVGEDQLPGESCLVPVGTGKPMAIFGLQNAAIRWDDFQRQTAASKYHDSWIEAITHVVTFSLKNQLAVDNSQVIVSYNETAAYRVILTTGIRYFNGDREFNLYFVEYLRREDFGDHETTLLFKGLELFVRFRSLFLETKSKFSPVGAQIAKNRNLKEYAVQMQRELNLLRRDALEAGLDKPDEWYGLVDPTHLLDLARAWTPIESKLRESFAQIRRSDLTNIEPSFESLLSALEELKTTMAPLNAKAIAELAEKLTKASTANATP